MRVLESRWDTYNDMEYQGTFQVLDDVPLHLSLARSQYRKSPPLVVTSPGEVHIGAYRGKPLMSNALE